MPIFRDVRQPELSTNKLADLRSVLEPGEILWSALADDEQEAVRLELETSQGFYKTVSSDDA